MTDIGAQTTSLLSERDAADPAKQSEFRSLEKDGQPDVSERALVDEIVKKIGTWKKHHEAALKKMKEDVRFAANKNGAQWGGTKAAPDQDRYVANITFRHIQGRTGVLYAKNPRVKAQRRKRLDYKIWDGTPEMLKMAEEALKAAAGVQPPPPPPDPAMIKVQGELAIAKEKAVAEIAARNAKMTSDQEAAAAKLQADREKMNHERQAAERDTFHAAQIHAHALGAARDKADLDKKMTVEKHNHDMQAARAKHSQDMKIKDEKAAADAKPTVSPADKTASPITAGAPAAAPVDPAIAAALKAISANAQSIEKLGEHIREGMAAQAEGHKVLSKAMTAKVKIAKGADGTWSRTHEE